MQGKVIGALLAATAEVMPEGVRAGAPYARDATLTPYGLTACVRVAVPGARRVEFILSVPAPVLDALLDLGAPSRDGRAAALAQTAQRIVERGVARAGLDGEVEGARIIVGQDVAMPWLRRVGRRLCVPWLSDVGGFVVEVGTGKGERLGGP